MKRPRHLVAGVLSWSVCAVCFALLHASVMPWNDLGGVVGERLRWLERLVAASGVIAGWTVGALARGESSRVPRAAAPRRLRLLLYPPALATALVLVALRAAGFRELVGVTVTALAAYCAGLSLSFRNVFVPQEKDDRRS